MESAYGRRGGQPARALAYWPSTYAKSTAACPSAHPTIRVVSLYTAGTQDFSSRAALVTV
eukprot:476805-Rhodomonas_salina.2